MDDNVLTIEHLYKSYNNDGCLLSVLNDVNIKLGYGVIAILGGNGAGKTTLIKSCTDLLSFDRGKVFYLGHDLKSMSKNEKTQMYSLLSEGSRNIYWKLSPIENIKYYAALRGIKYRDIKDFCLSAFDELNIYDKKDELVENLSKGMQQKVAVVCALSMNTKVIFLDEPTLGLDIESSIHLSKFLSKNESLKDRLICITSHDFNFIEKTTNAVFKLQDGVLIGKENIECTYNSYLIKIDNVDANIIKQFNYEIVETSPQNCTIRVSAPYYKLGEIISDMNSNGFNVSFIESERNSIINFYLNDK